MLSSFLVKPPQAVLVDAGLEEPIIVHGWPGGRKAPSAIFLGARVVISPMSIPQEEIERRSTGWKIREDGIWDVVETQNAIIYAQGFGASFLRSVGVHLEEFNLMLRSALGGPAPRRPFGLRIFSNRKDFCTHAACLGAYNAESLYDPNSAVMAMLSDPSKPEWWAQRIIAHETTHAYMHLVYDVVRPLWFAEGMAEFFANFSWQDGALSPGALNPEILRRLKLDRESLVPIFEFVNLGREAMYGADFAMLYAQSWALVHFLMAEQPSEIQDLLKKGPAAIDEDAFWRHLDEMLQAVPA